MGQEIHQAQQLHLHKRPRSHPSAQFFCPLTHTGGEWLPQWEPRCLWVLLRCHSPFSHQTFDTVLCRPKVHIPTDSSPSQVQLHTTTKAGTISPNYLNCFQTHQVWETKNILQADLHQPNPLCVLLTNIHKSFNRIEPQNSHRAIEIHNLFPVLCSCVSCIMTYLDPHMP